ncbi:3626_t:CDS:2 [Ambispora gerdemannii]|uniref:3626_t:CDS:1 n=1 Tax=Ambispora gerdemannii TaxID=144530 RepID=A0A9N9FWU5_9GLOM|nr:3626_t:CDS:2 [Ambispora gerdemannii]
MTSSLKDDTRIVFKAQGHREEYFVMKWRKDKTIPLADVIQTFDVYEITNGGNEGIAGRPSKQRLENAFGTSNLDEVIEQILEHGTIHHVYNGKGRTAKAVRSTTNDTRGKGIATA